MQASNPLVSKVLIFFTRYHIPIIWRLYQILLGCDIGVRLSWSTCMGHPYGIVIHGRAKIGENVTILHQVTIGCRKTVMESPSIGDNVYIGAGAKILGDITVGSNTKVGANAVVTKDVPSNATVINANQLLSKSSE